MLLLEKKRVFAVMKNRMYPFYREGGARHEGGEGGLESGRKVFSSW